MDVGVSSVGLWAALIALTVFLWSAFFRRSRIRELVGKLPGPPTWPLLGNALDLYVEHSEILPVVARFCKEYGARRIFRIWIGSEPWIILFRGKAVETVLSSTRLIDKSNEYVYVQPWLGTGLLTSTGDKWRSRRKLLTPAFHFRILEEFLGVYNEQSEILVKRVSKEVGKSCFDMFPYITLCTLDIICETAMGRHVNAQGNSESEYVKAVYRIGDIIHSRQMRPWLWPSWLFNLTSNGREHKHCLKLLHSFSTQVIKERRAEWEAKGRPTPDQDAVFGKKTRLAFLDLLLQASDDGRLLSDMDIREEVDTFMFEGHDTTAAGITWTLYLLGCHPHIQKKVHDELDSIFGDSDRRVTSEDLKEMKYLEIVIKEALRLFPSVPLFGRELHEDVVIEGYTIPAGVTAMIVSYALHRDPEVFPDPELFNPDRFLPENCVGRHPYAYVPFSAGPRNCIGQKFAMMEEKVVLSQVLRSYAIESLEPREEMKLLAELILRPQNGLQARLTARR